MDYNRDISRYIPKVIAILIPVIVVAVICVPIVNALTMEQIDIEEHNVDPIGVDLSVFDLTKSHSNKSITVTLSGSSIEFSGDYTGTVNADDMIIMVSDSNSLVCKDGQLLYFDGSSTSSVEDITLTIIGNTVNSTQATYVYFPDADGIYATYYEYEYSFSDCVAVGTFAGATIISNENDIEKSNVDGYSAEVQEDESGVYGVDYTRSE